MVGQPTVGAGPADSSRPISLGRPTRPGLYWHPYNRQDGTVDHWAYQSSKSQEGQPSDTVRLGTYCSDASSGDDRRWSDGIRRRNISQSDWDDTRKESSRGWGEGSRSPGLRVRHSPSDNCGRRVALSPSSDDRKKVKFVLFGTVISIFPSDRQFFSDRGGWGKSQVPLLAWDMSGDPSLWLLGRRPCPFCGDPIWADGRGETGYWGGACSAAWASLFRQREGDRVGGLVEDCGGASPIGQTIKDRFAGDSWWGFYVEDSEEISGQTK